MTGAGAAGSVEAVFREERGRLLALLVRQFGDLDLAEDAASDAIEAALERWPAEGVPATPLAWLLTTARRKAVDRLRRDKAYAARLAIMQVEAQQHVTAAPEMAGQDIAGAREAFPDERLRLFFTCCHPALSLEAQTALTLRCLAGLSTPEVARAFLVPEATMTRRITRAKQSIKDSGVPFRMPAHAERAERLAAVLHVLYLIFTEGYAATSGPSLLRPDLSGEAIRLARIVHRLMPDDPEGAGLLALMLLIDARRPARTGPDGSLVPMAEQNRSLWNADYISEGIALITDALPRGPVGPYQLQAAIAAMHDEAPTIEATDWPQIVELYELLLQMSDNPVVALNHAVAVAMARGPQAGLDLLAGLEADQRIAADHRLAAVRAHLLEMTGDRAAARDAYLAAAQRTLNLAQQRYLHAQAARITGDQ